MTTRITLQEQWLIRVVVNQHSGRTEQILRLAKGSLGLLVSHPGHVFLYQTIKEREGGRQIGQELGIVNESQKRP